MIKRIIANTGYQVIGKVVMVAVSLVVTGMLTRGLGPVGYGILVLITALTSMLDSVADFGTKIIGVREMSCAKQNKNKEIFGAIVRLRLMLAVISALVGLVLVNSLPAFAGYRTEATVAMVMIMLTSFLGNLEIVFLSRLKMELKLVIDVVYPLLTLVLIKLFFDQLSLMMVIGIYIAGRILSLGVGFLVARGLIGSEGVLKQVQDDKIKEIFKKSWPMGVYLLIFSSYDRLIDSVILERYLGVAVVAYYGLAYKIYLNLVQGAYFLMNSTFPLMSRGDKERKQATKNSLGLLLAALAVVLPTMYGLAPWMVRVLAPVEFVGAVEVLRILLLALVFSYFSHLVGFRLISKGGEKKMVVVAIVTLAVNLLGNIAVIPYFGAIGAAWVTVATEATGLAMMGLMGK